MANPSEKHPLNAPGAFYNDISCIDCDICRSMAPQIFTRDEEEGMSYVWQQPTIPEDLILAHEAMTNCPTETIGSDG